MTRRRLLTTVAVALLATFVVAATAVWLALPSLARWATVRQVEAYTGRKLTMREFTLDLRGGHLRITGLRLDDREPGPPLAELDRLEVRFRPGALLRGHVWIEDLALDNPRVRIVRTARGVLNISDLLRPSKPREGTAAVTLDRFALTGGAILFEDRELSPPRTWRADALAIEASLLSTVNPEPRGRGRLTATVAGAPLTVEMSEVRLAPMHGRVRLDLANLDATLANLYLPPDTAVVLERALVSAGLTAVADAQDGLRLDGQARLDNLVVRRRGADTALVTVPSLAFALTTVNGADGRPRGRVEVAGRATVHDPRPGQTNRFELERLKLVLDGLDASGRAPTQVTLAAALPGGGALDVQGTARSTPLGSTLRARISRVDLAFWAPYLDLPLQFNGMIETDLTVDVATAAAAAGATKGGAVTARVRGSAALNGATVYGPRAVDGAPAPTTGATPPAGARPTTGPASASGAVPAAGAPSEDQTREGRRRLIAADRMEMTGLDAQWPKVRVERLRLARPRVTLERDRAGRFPILDIVQSLRPTAAPAPSAAPAVKPTTATTGALALEIGEVAVEAGRVRFDDASVTPAARLRVEPIALSAKDVTWPGRQPARVKFSAGTPEAGTFEAEGTVALDPTRFELRARVAGVALAPYRAYVPLSARLQGRLEADMALKGQLGETMQLNARGTAAVGDLSFSDGDRPVLTVSRIEATGLDYTWPATAAIERVHMKKSWVHIDRRADGTLPITTLFAPARPAPGVAQGPPAPLATPAPSATPAPPAAIDTSKATVTVREAIFEDGSATIVDAAVSPPARLEVAGVRLAARDFQWPARGAIPVQLDMSTPGSGTLTAKGQLDLTAKTIEAQVTPRGMDLSPVRPYLPVRGRIAGKAGGDLQVKATLEPLTITVRGAATLADLAVADGDRPVATAARLETTGIDYTWPATVVIETARLQKPWAQIERAPDGTFPITALLTPAPSAGGGARREPAGGGSPPTGSAPTEPKVDVRVRRVAVEEGVIVIVDGAVSPPGRIQLQGASLQLENIGWPAREASHVKLRTETANGGHLEVQGQVRVDTQAVDVQLAAKQLDLATMQAFLPSRGTIEGKMDADLRVRGTLAPLSVAAIGRLAFDDPTFGDGQRMLAYIKRVDVARLDVDWPRRVTVERVAVDKPWVLMEREADGTMPLLGLQLAGPSTPRGAAVPADAGAPPPVVRVGTLAVEEGFVRFVDRSTTPAFTEEASRIALTGRGLGTAPDSRGQVAMNGRLTGGAPFEIKGTLGAIGGPLNLEIDGKLTDFPLTRVNPYSNKLIGWVARRGAFGATVHYRVVDNRIEATNDLFIGQPEYAPSRSGDEVRERVGVPFGMLVSLLKNARGEIKLSVPVSGDLASGQFDLSDAFWAAMRETAVSVMALPVSWVGKIFYTEDARIETVRIWPVHFEPGTTRITRDFEQHAERLAGFLRDAPGLTLAMKAVHTVEDIVALKRAAVRQRIDAGAREPGQTAEAVAARLFAERFPGQAPPSGLDALVLELVKAEPNPDAAARNLAAQRMETTRARLQAARGTANAERLRATEGVVPVEASGQGRIEFEIAP